MDYTHARGVSQGARATISTPAYRVCVTEENFKGRFDQAWAYPAEKGMAKLYKSFHLLYNQSMTRRTVISRLRKHRTQLTKLGVKSLSLFGSVARGEESSDSDVDILVEFKGKATNIFFNDA